MDKPGALDDEEWEKMKSHAKVGYQVLGRFPSLIKYRFATLHHERWDGKGYPFGLRGDQTSLGARIIAASDMLDALTSRRPYRKALTFKEALSIIREEKGRKFDPQVVEVFFDTFSCHLDASIAAFPL